MKLGFKTSSILLSVALLLCFSSFAVANNVTVSLVSRVLQSFDPNEVDTPNARTWKLFPSKFGIDRDGNSMWEMQLISAWPEALFGKNREKDEFRVLGLHGKFLRKGYNSVEIVPGTGEGENFRPVPLPIPGRVDMLDLWVWGSNHKYYMEAHVRDQEGVDHVLPLGSIKHIGWKNLRTKFPTSIPQTWTYVPRYRQLIITKLVLWTRPEEKVDDFYMYIDHIKVLTDLFEASYDGDELAEKDRLQEIWGSAID